VLIIVIFYILIYKEARQKCFFYCYYGSLSCCYIVIYLVCFSSFASLCDVMNGPQALMKPVQTELHLCSQNLIKLIFLIIIIVSLLAREKLDDNLVNAMETIDNDLGTGQSAKPNLPALMFRIASKSKLTLVRWQ